MEVGRKVSVHLVAVMHFRGYDDDKHVASYQKPLKKKQILLELSIHFAVWFVFSIWLWTRFHWDLRSDLVPILVAPIYFGFSYVRSGYFWTWGAFGLLTFATLICTTFYSIKNRRRRAVLVAHFAVLLYWLVGFALIAIGD